MLDISPIIQGCISKLAQNIINFGKDNNAVRYRKTNKAVEIGRKAVWSLRAMAAKTIATSPFVGIAVFVTFVSLLAFYYKPLSKQVR